MGVMPKQVFTRRLALAAEYGLEAQLVLADGFDAEGVEVLGDIPGIGTVIFSDGEFLKTKVLWKPEDRQRARDAMNGDFAEQFASAAASSPTLAAVLEAQKFGIVLSSTEAAYIAEAVLAASGLRDEHHTMDELYEYRMLYNALAFNEAARRGTYPVVKSWRHSDGELCFGGGWFIVVATLPTGQVSNHYKAEFWPLFNVDVHEPPTYDGHTPAEAAARIREWLVT